MASIIGVAATFIAAVSILGGPVYQRAVTLGLTRGKIVNDHGSELRTIANTIACEDLHYDEKSDRLYTACQGDIDVRSKWFPPNVLFDHEASGHQGHLSVINPNTFESTALSMDDFKGPLIPHGIDIFTNDDEPDSTYIFVINHMANPKYYASNPTSKVKGLDSVEVFKHKVGTRSATFLRSVQHPLLRTTNDLVATSPTSFYITNDHYYAEGFMRNLEELGEYHTAGWSDISYVEFDVGEKEPDAGVTAKTALTGLHNNNGLGKGRPGYPEIVINDAGGGRMYRARMRESDHALDIIEAVQLDSALDNPFYFDDKYATTGGNASGYILPGYPLAYSFFGDFPHPERPIPAMVWHLRSGRSPARFESSNQWEHRVVFQDDGNLLRSASGAVLLGIDPAKTGGRKQGWLFVTGGAARACIALKIDL